MKSPRTGKVKEIKLTRGRVALVDEADYESLSTHRWYCVVKPNSPIAYAASTKERNRKKSTVFMHRIIVGAGVGQHVDHKDGDGLNNTRGNLRIVTHRENQRNRKTHRENPISLGTYLTKDGYWKAQLKVKGKSVYLGLFPTQKEAHEAFLLADAHHNS